ncbi:MAG: hypothetical protein CVU44_02375 [Chloroflexi bacterium HGW-Chloroflexi-6]|nr:MAG: hypothetical protein CVU44_02375 [Chloroflexi bacterium HGW-Chloroflexi-6]
MDTRYTTPISNPFEGLPEDIDAVEHEPLFETGVQQVGIADWLKNNAHNIAFIAGNLLLAAGEYRVYDFAMQNTGEAWKAWFAVLATFFPFILWEIAVQHAKASGLMRGVAWLGMAISFSLGVIIGIAEFSAVGGQIANAEALLGLLAGSLSIHAVLFLVYFYSHPDIKAKRLTAVAVAKQEMAERNAEVAESVLGSARNRLELERRIAAEYGYENLRRAIAEIEGRHYHTPKKTYAPRKTLPHSPTPVPLNIPEMLEPAPAHAFGANGHGKPKSAARPGESAPDFS